jgi:general secretion pathway protein F
MQIEAKMMDRQGKIHVHLFDVHNEAEAYSKAVHLNMDVLSLRIKRSSIFSNRSKSKFDVLIFSQELVALLKAGLSLVESIDVLTERSLMSTNYSIFHSLKNSLQEGQTFSAALAAQSKIFPEIYQAMVKASEKTGDLSKALARWVAYRSQVELVKRKVISAAIYPLLLILVGGAVTLFLLGYVVPKFSSIYENAGDNLPFLSKLLMEWGKLLHDHGFFVFIGIILLVSIVIGILSLKQTRQWITESVWKLPNVGPKIKIYQLSRFYRTLGMLLQGGVPLVNALEMTSGLLSPNLRQKLLLAIQGIREGKPLSDTLEKYSLATPVSKRMMIVGEETGNMAEMMESSAAFYDQEVSQWVDWTIRLVEPVLMALMGLIIGGIVILMYLPIFELADTIQS